MKEEYSDNSIKVNWNPREPDQIKETKNNFIDDSQNFDYPYDTKIITPEKSYFIGCMIIIVMFIVWIFILQRLYPTDDMAYTLGSRNRSSFFYYSLLFSGATFLLLGIGKGGILSENDAIPPVHLAVLKIFGRRIHKLFGRPILLGEGRIWIFPGIMGYIMRSMIQEDMEVTYVGMCKPDDEGVQIEIEVTFVFQWRRYNIFKNIEIDESAVLKGIRSAMLSACGNMLSEHTGDEMMGAGRKKIASWIENEFKLMHDPKNSMQIVEWGVEIMTPITVNKCAPNSKAVIEAYESKKQTKLLSEAQTIKISNLRKNILLLEKGVYRLKRIENGKEIESVYIIDTEKEINLSTKELLDAVQFELGRPGKNEYILDSKGALDKLFSVIGSKVI